MGHKDKESETSLPIYAPHASPKPDSTLQGQDEPTVERASIAMLVVANMPRMAIQMAWASWWAAMGPSLGAILPRSSVWSIQIVGPLSGLVIGPVIGAFSDRSTNPWGRRRPFLLWGAIFNAIFLVVMGYTRGIGKAFGDSGDGYYYQPTDTTATAIMAVVFFTCMAITLNVVHTPVILLVADIAGDRQTVAAAIGICWSLVGNTVTIAYFEIVGSGALHPHYFLGFLAVVMLVTVGIVCAVITEKSPALPSTTGVLHSVVKMPSTLIVYGVLLMIVSYGNSLYQGYKSMFFALEVLSGQAEGSYFCEPDCTEAQNNYNRGMNLFDNARAVTYEAASCVYYLILPLLAKKFGTKAVIVVAFVPQALLLIVTYIKVFIVAAMVDVVVTVLQSTAFVLLVPAIVHVFGKDVDIGACVGLLSGISGVGPIISVGVGAAMVETSMGFKLPVLLGGIFALVGIIVTSVFLKLKMHVL